MFFVGVGIIVLFASFAIALISLIREQNERVEAIGESAQDEETATSRLEDRPQAGAVAQVDQSPQMPQEPQVSGQEPPFRPDARRDSLSGEISLRTLKRSD